MTMYEKNRQIVQNGLNRRAATAAQKEAALEAMGREFRAGINEHSLDITAAQEAQRRKEAQEAAAARRRERQAQREAAECYTWYATIALIVGPLLVAALAIGLYNTGNLALWIMLIIAVTACMYSAASLIVNIATLCKFPSLRGTINRICDAAEKFRAYLTVPMMSEFDN